MPWLDFSAAAIGYVQVPIRRGDVVLRREMQHSCGFIDRRGRAFKFQKISQRRFVQIQMQTGQSSVAIGGSEFFVDEPRAIAERLENRLHLLDGFKFDLDLPALFITREGRRAAAIGFERRLVRKDPAPTGPAMRQF